MSNILISLVILTSLNVNSQTEYYPFQNTERKWGIINSKLQTVFEPVFESEISFFFNHNSKNPVAKFRVKNKKYGLLNHLGKEILEPLYDMIYPTENDKIIILRIGNQKSVYNIENKEIVIDNLNRYQTKIKVENNSIKIIEEKKETFSKYDLTGQIEWEKQFPEEEIIIESVEDGIVDNNSLEENSKNSGEKNIETKSNSSENIASHQKTLDRLGNQYNGLQRLDKDHVLVTKYANTTSTTPLFGLFSLTKNEMVFKPEYDFIKKADTNFKNFEEFKHKQAELSEYLYISKNGISGYANLENGKVFIPEE